MKQEMIGWTVFYISMAVVIVWVVLKLAGVIHSPVYQEIIPLIAFVVAIFSLGFNFGKPLARLETKVDNIGSGLRNLGKDFKHQER